MLPPNTITLMTKAREELNAYLAEQKPDVEFITLTKAADQQKSYSRQCITKAISIFDTLTASGQKPEYVPYQVSHDKNLQALLADYQLSTLLG